MGIFAFTCPYTWLTQTILRNFFEKIKKKFLKRWSLSCKSPSLYPKASSTSSYISGASVSFHF